VPRDGSVGKETFDQVEALLKQGKSKSEAFAQVASDSGKNAGTVSANYYRVARVNGTVKPRGRRRKAAHLHGLRGPQQVAEGVRAAMAAVASTG
jgi:hypothetical protein